jgi:adenylate cyclase
VKTAALAMVASLPQLAVTTGVDLQIRIGINSGHVVVGLLGSKHHRKDVTVIGDNVNVAARLESLGKANQVVISESTRALLGPALSTKNRGVVSVKGRKEPVQVWQVFG